MAVNLEGGCRVTDMREGVPEQHGTMRVWPQINRATGAQAISLRVLEFARGLSPAIRNQSCDEILYVLERPEELATDQVVGKDFSRREAEVQGPSIYIDGWPFVVTSETGIYLRPGQTFTVENSSLEPLVLISSRCPDPKSSEFELIAPVMNPLSASPPASSIVWLGDRRARPTADRWYRVLIDGEVGSTQATQFVGSIPPGRAPDHFHEYEEVLFILRGAGRMWAGETSTPIAAGCCIYLPKGQVHCVENTGSDELRLLGVFYPAGSPSVRYEV
jgi:mannose-6-phosphate isomerase-like protein (cupin superfamily)